MSRKQGIAVAFKTVATLLMSLWAATSHATTELYYVHADHLGTPQVMTDKNQDVVWKRSQTPFGETVEETGTLEQPLRLPGQYRDRETGFSYNYFRDYDPELGRYLQSDPIGLLSGLNTYGYVYQNSLIYIDPYGLITSDEAGAIGSTVGGAIGGAVNGAITGGSSGGLPGAIVGAIGGAAVGGSTGAVSGAASASLGTGGATGAGLATGGLRGGAAGLAGEAAGAVIPGPGGAIAGGAAGGAIGGSRGGAASAVGGAVGGAIGGAISAALCWGSAECRDEINKESCR